MYKLYEKYEDQMEVKLSNLPSCDKYKINSNKTNSLWQFLFVKPLAFIILKVGLLFKNIGMTHAYLGLSVILIGLLNKKLGQVILNKSKIYDLSKKYGFYFMYISIRIFYS